MKLRYFTFRADTPQPELHITYQAEDGGPTVMFRVPKVEDVIHDAIGTVTLGAHAEFDRADALTERRVGPVDRRAGTVWTMDPIDAGRRGTGCGRRATDAPS
jgi:hypothetical protein